jgi:hypothetical protein
MVGPPRHVGFVPEGDIAAAFDSKEKAARRRLSILILMIVD